jgi:flagellar biosynthesis/type III secretory pathway protein FliH
MQQLLDKWERLRRSEYLRPDEKLMLNHCISDLKRFTDHSGEVTEMVGKRTAVEWLSEQFDSIVELYPSQFERVNRAIEQAKEMEKERMIEFAWECQEMFKHEIKEHFEEKFNDGGNK